MSEQSPQLTTDPKSEDVGEVDAFRHFLSRVGKTSLLTAVEEVEYSMQCETGLYAEYLIRQAEETGDELPHPKEDLDIIIQEGREAKRIMIASNIRLVISKARKYKAGHPLESFDDIVQNGMIGLLKAVERFDYKKGNKFSTYAVWSINTAFARNGRDDTIRLPIWALDKHAEILTNKHRFYQENDYYPTDEQLAEMAGISPKAFDEIMRARNLAYLNTPVDDQDSEIELGDLIVESDSLLTEDVTVDRLYRDKFLAAAYGLLDHRSIKAVKLLYGIETGQRMTYDAVGENLGVTKERARQIVRDALSRVRRNIPDSFRL